MEPEAGNWPKICLLDTRSVCEPAFGGLTICSLTSLRIEKHLIPPKSLLLPHTFGFSFSVFSQGWKVFSSTISMIFRFFSHSSLPSSESFPLINSLVRFSFPVSLIMLGSFFTSNKISFETHQLPYGARMFLLVSWFSSSVSTRLGCFLSTQ